MSAALRLWELVTTDPVMLAASGALAVTLLALALVACWPSRRRRTHDAVDVSVLARDAAQQVASDRKSARASERRASERRASERHASGRVTKRASSSSAARARVREHAVDFGVRSARARELVASGASPMEVARRTGLSRDALALCERTAPVREASAAARQKSLTPARLSLFGRGRATPANGLSSSN